MVKMPQGFSPIKGKRKIAIEMPEALFLKICERANRDGVSFNSVAVKMLDCGVFDYEESEACDAA